jgi:hypothetical protein
MVQFLNQPLRIIADDAIAGTEFADIGRLKEPPDVTFIVHGMRSDDATTTAVRLRADTAVAKARDLIVAGWQVFIECPAGIQNYPDDFDNLLSDSQDESGGAVPLRQIESELDGAVLTA